MFEVSANILKYILQVCQGKSAFCLLLFYFVLSYQLRVRTIKISVAFRAIFTQQITKKVQLRLLINYSIPCLVDQ